MKNRPVASVQERPLLYYKNQEDIEAYKKKSVKLKLQWLEAQMEFFYRAMPDEAKRIRDRLKRGDI